MKPFRILQIGLGPLGVRVAHFAAQRASLEIVGAVEKNPDLVGRDLAEFAGIRLADRVTIAGSISEAISGREMPDVAILTTVSDLELIVPQIEAIVSEGIPVISSCEELSYPRTFSPSLAARLDEMAHENGVAILGTGVNPGFLMDTLPVQLTGICQRVDSIQINRFQNARFRRLPFQRKIGAGLTLKAFREKADQGMIRHVGLGESMEMIAVAMNWELDRLEETISPVIAVEAIELGERRISQGEASGLRQVGRGFAAGRLKVELVFQASVGEPESFDEIVVKGEPDIRSRIDGGVNGDEATCAVILNAIPRVVFAQPGLKTMIDLPIVSYFE